MATVKLSPVFNDQVVDQNGAPANGYLVNTYAAASSTPAPTYTDSTGSVAQSNPVVINANGYPTQGQIWLAAGQAYKLVLTTPAGVVIKTMDGITGVNDTGATTDEWADSGINPVYIGVNSYSASGDQTQSLQIGRRQKFLVTSGVVYGRILSAVFSSLTVVVVQMDGTQTLDSGLSSVQNSILRANVLSLPERIATTTGVVNVYVASVGILRLVIGDEYKLKFAIANDGALAPTLNMDATGALPLILQNGAVPFAGAINGEHIVRATVAGFVVMNPNVIVPATMKRQAITSAPVDANGYTALGGATGGTTLVTTALSSTAPIIVLAAGGTLSTGVLGDRVGISLANVTWTGLTINGTMQLSFDVAANGAMTPIAGALLTNYQEGGAFSIVNGQHTFNTGVMNQTIGNGSAAVQSYRVAVGEVLVAGGVVTAITWYALNRRYVSADTAFAAAGGNTMNFNDNLGFSLGVTMQADAVCQNTNSGWTAGQIIQNITVATNPGSYVSSASPLGKNTRNTTSYTTGVTTAYFGVNKSTGDTSTNNPGNAGSVADFKLRITSRVNW